MKLLMSTELIPLMKTATFVHAGTDAIVEKVALATDCATVMQILWQLVGSSNSCTHP